MTDLRERLENWAYSSDKSPCGDGSIILYSARNAVRMLDLLWPVVEAAIRIEDPTSANKESSARPRHQSFADWELRLIAREALATLEQKLSERRGDE